MHPSLQKSRFAALALALCSFAPSADAQSIARQWNELLLESIRHDLARPTVHARNLYHMSVAMWDAWATYDLVAQPVLFDEDHATFDLNVDQYRAEALSYACYNILRARFGASPGAPTMFPQYNAFMNQLGFNKDNSTTLGNSPAAIGNRIAVTVLAHGLADHANEQGGYANQHYVPVNPPLVPGLPGNPNIVDPNRWQPLALDFFIDQGGNVIVGGYPEFLSPEWGQVTPFSLSQNDVTIDERDGFDYWVYHDPGPPPKLGTDEAQYYKWGFELVSAWSSHLDPADNVMIDISPGAIGGATLPSDVSTYDLFYDFVNGGDNGAGHATNPVTGLPYPPQIVPRGDYTRILAEFWADGPDSETPPGHWFVLLNQVSDDPNLVKRIGGQGPVLSDFEWDVKAYLVLGGAMHDVAVASWGVKGYYDYLRPISAIRHMAALGQCTFPTHANYHVDGITLHPGLIESVTFATTAAGQKHAHLAGNEGKIAVKAWRGPTYITNPDTDVAGVGWILAENWWPYQRPSFVTPPFAGYVSGHSTYSRTAAIIMHQLTGSPYFPGGIGQFTCPKNQFLVFEDGPSVDVTLQWATYYDASDQCSLSRIWGGIHPPADDIPGRRMGDEIGPEAFARAVQYWNGTACDVDGAVTLYGYGCAGNGGIAPKLTVDGCAEAGGDVTMKLAKGNPQALALLTIGLFETDLPAAGDCSLYVSPTVLAVPLPLGGTPGVPGSGSFEFTTTLPPSTPTGTALKLQGFVTDATNAWGYTATNGVSLGL
ncbi:MAG: vanadium-dependent haloperoxidase [Planctomycetota bacterium JB042]